VCQRSGIFRTVLADTNEAMRIIAHGLEVVVAVIVHYPVADPDPCRQLAVSGL
jgi:hypothetical protein